MRQHFAWWLKFNWDLKVDPMDDRLEIGHLWDWVAYLDELAEYDDLQEINDAWSWHLANFQINRNSDERFDIGIIVTALTDTPMNVDDRRAIMNGQYDLVYDEVGIRLDILINFN